MNVKISVKGTTIEIKNDKKKLIDHVMDYNKSQEALNIIQQEAMTLSAESVIDDQNNQKTLIQKIIDFFKRLKDAVIRAFKRFIGFIRHIFEILFNKHQIKDIQIDENVSSDVINQKNDKIKLLEKSDDVIKQNSDNIKNDFINPSSNTNIGVRYLLSNGKVIQSVIDIGNINQYAVFEGIKSIPNCANIENNLKYIQTSSDLITKVMSDGLNESDVRGYISNLQDMKRKLFVEATDNNTYTNVKLCISNFKGIKQLDQISKLGNDIGEKLDKCISGLNNSVDKETSIMKHQQKIIGLYSTLVTGYISSIVRIYIELTRIIEADVRILGDDADVGLYDKGVSVKRSFDTYYIDLRKVLLSKNAFTDDEYKHLRGIVDKLVSYFNAGNKSTITNRDMNTLYGEFLDIFMKKSNKLKMFTGKINNNTALTMYNFSAGYEGNGDIFITCQIVVDNRKKIDMSNIQTLYHVSYSSNLTEISSTIGNSEGMAGQGDLGQSIITKGNKLRVYASKYPVIKNGFPISDEGIYELIRVYNKMFFKQLVNKVGIDSIDSENILTQLLGGEKLYIYKIDPSKLRNANVYADPEHNGVLSKIIHKQVSDNCVYIETTDEKIKLDGKLPLSNFVNFNNVTNKLKDYVRNNIQSDHSISDKIDM